MKKLITISIIITFCFSIFLSTNVFCMNKKFEEFISDSRFKDGISWGNDKVSNYGNWSMGGCASYCQEFVHYCYGLNKPQDGEYFDNKDEIRSGDVIYKKWGDGAGDQHWYVCLDRNGNKLKIAEGNYNADWPNGYRPIVKIRDVDLYKYNDSFQYGWHYNIPDDNIGSNDDSINNSQKLQNSIIDEEIVEPGSGWSQATVKELLNKWVSSGIAIDYNGVGGYDEVDVLLRYIRHITGDYFRNMSINDFAVSELPVGFIRKTSNEYEPQPGDIVVWKGKTGPAASGDGHTGIVYEMLGSKIKIVDQDSTLQRAPQFNEYKYSGEMYFLIPTFNQKNESIDTLRFGNINSGEVPKFEKSNNNDNSNNNNENDDNDNINIVSTNKTSDNNSIVSSQQDTINQNNTNDVSSNVISSNNSSTSSSSSQSVAQNNSSTNKSTTNYSNSSGSSSSSSSSSAGQSMNGSAKVYSNKNYSTTEETTFNIPTIEIKVEKHNINEVVFVYNYIQNSFNLINIQNFNIIKDTVCTIDNINLFTGQMSSFAYYFDKDGKMQTGWVKDKDGKYYYFEEANTIDIGKMIYGWKKIDGAYYYFDMGGRMLENTITPDGYKVGTDGAWMP